MDFEDVLGHEIPKSRVYSHEKCSNPQGSRIAPSS